MTTEFRISEFRAARSGHHNLTDTGQHRVGEVHVPATNVRKQGERGGAGV